MSETKARSRYLSVHLLIDAPARGVLEHATVDTSNTWNGLDCDGDGVTTRDEKKRWYDPLDPMLITPESFITAPRAISRAQSEGSTTHEREWETVK